MIEYIEQTTEESMAKWRRAIFASNIIFAVFVFLTEIVMFVILEFQGLRVQSLFAYLTSYLVVPTVIDAVILVVGYYLAKANPDKPKLKNYIVVIQMVLICFMLTVVHHVFYVTFCTYCFPIFVSVIFNDEKMPRRITGLSLICLTISQFIGPWINNIVNEYQIANFVVAAVIIGAINVLCELMIEYQNQKNEKIAQMHFKRLEMLEQMKYDQKTGLHGHTSFQNGLKHLVETARLEECSALAMIDIDDFKSVNDTYGHIKGDVILLELARIIKEVCGDRYIPARFGGEEFAILFQGGSLEEYVCVVETIRKEFAKSWFEFCRESVTMSAGIATWQSGWGTIDLLDHADEALYRSKHQGKNRTTITDGEVSKPASLYPCAYDKKNES